MIIIHLRFFKWKKHILIFRNTAKARKQAKKEDFKDEYRNERRITD
jgi:hypothetical protein